MQMNDLPDSRGHFGPYGGVFVAETLVHALDELKREYERYRADPAFLAEFRYELKHYVGRPSPVYHAKRWSERLGGAQIFLKREDVNHTGAHKINNTIGQALLARRMGKPRVIAETGAGHARRGERDRRRALRHGMRRVHGRGGRQAAGRQRLPDEGPRRDGGAGRVGLEDAQGRPERGDARLGDERRQHVLHHRHRRRPASLSDDGPRLPARDRPRMPGADARGRRAAARCGHRLRGRRLERNRHFLRLHPAPRRAPDRRRGGRARPRDREARGFAQRRQARRAPRQPHLPPPGRARPDRRDALRLVPGSTTRGSVRSTRG